jgi:hypothetical protein
MDIQSNQSDKAKAAEGAWAKPVERLKSSAAPQGVSGINVDGRQLTSPIQGFGQMWQKTFKVRLPGVGLTPAEVMATWRLNFPSFLPPDSRFYPSMAGIHPGEVVLIHAKVPPLPGMPSFLPVDTGVMVLYADDESFTVMTPEGHPEAGWNTFSVYDEDGCVVAQAQSLCRPSDPLYEVFNRYLGSSSQQDGIWLNMLTNLAEHFGVKGQATSSKALVDPKVQWSQAKNIWKNAAIRTVFYLLGAPLRWVRGKGSRTDN